MRAVRGEELARDGDAARRPRAAHSTPNVLRAETPSPAVLRSRREKRRLLYVAGAPSRAQKTRRARHALI